MPPTESDHLALPQVTLVALYASKPSNIATLVQRCQSIAVDGLGDEFHPYALDQVHATITGMERIGPVAANANDARALINRNARDVYDRDLEMRFDLLAQSVASHLPITIRWGGYIEGDIKYRGSCQTPFSKSIYFNRRTGRLVLIGWPHRDGDFSTHRLFDLRNDLEAQCSLVHKYRNDNDLFQVLGKFDADAVDPTRLAIAERALAGYLASVREDVELTTEDCRIVCYRDTTLPPETTQSFPVSGEHISHEFVAGLFND